MNIQLEPRERMILEISAAVIFLALVICGSIVVVQASSAGDTETTITNSFNTYNFYSNSDGSRFSRMHDRDYSREKFYDIKDSKEYYKDENKKSEKRHLYYDARGRLINSEGIFGNDIKKYEVTVRNEDYTGGYFKVKYYLKDHYGRTEAYSDTIYVPARSEKKSYLKDISPSKYEYSRWSYSVDSLTEVPSKDKYDYDW